MVAAVPDWTGVDVVVTVDVDADEDTPGAPATTVDDEPEVLDGDGCVRSAGAEDDVTGDVEVGSGEDGVVVATDVEATDGADDVDVVSDWNVEVDDGDELATWADEN